MRKIRRWGVWLLLIIPLALNAQQRAEKLLNVPLPEHWQEEDAMFQQLLPVDVKVEEQALERKITIGRTSPEWEWPGRQPAALAG